MKKIIVIGGGAAGMMAAITAAGNNNKVVLVEKNEKLGKKIFITGKGRCNFTNAGDSDDLMNSIVTNKNSCTVHLINSLIMMRWVSLENLGWILKSKEETEFFQRQTIHLM